jgi:hypothetical protein
MTQHTNTWTNHVKAFAKDKGITYKSALQDPQCSASYKANKAKTQEESQQPQVVRRRPRKPKIEEAKPKVEPNTKVEGTGVLSTGYVTENANGLGQIYPISHELVLRMINQNGM